MASLLRTPGGTAYDLSGMSNKPVVLLIHGLGLNRHIWAQHKAALAEHHRVVTYDLLFHGESAHPSYEPSLDLFSDQIIELLDHLGVKLAALVGFSLGGMINRHFASVHPDRVSALVILNSPSARTPEQQRISEERAMQTAIGGPAANIDQTIERWFTPRFRAQQPGVVSEVRKWVLANETNAYSKCRMILAKDAASLVEIHPSIRSPTLIMTCECDSGSTPTMAAAMAKEIGGAKIVVIPRLQHLGLLEEPDIFSGPICSFINSTIDE